MQDSATVEEHQVNQDDPVEYHVPLGQRGTEATRLLLQALAYIARRHHVLQTLKRLGNSILVLHTPHYGVQSLGARMEEVAVDAHQLWKCVEDVRVPLPAAVDVSIRTIRGEADPLVHANQLVRDIVDVHLVPVKSVQPKQEGHVELDHVERHDDDEFGGTENPDVKAPDRIVLSAPEL
ncbi:hypothetical protein BU14_0152s0035 [Porphyra umbilicalis]|uniref:Uncharacterized protein n=1 Tax=Porphyra umbilicalis TaxID=2786 RepID=A0A1X6P999_PORUM|nr:hypothetical protein BU14_0152s0035 [Porphyra umbilicalis]|eukprot:OSX77340.1 hypothetical protein BU14_0152s0035 [Porphyra umbilicalis]